MLKIDAEYIPLLKNLRGILLGTDGENESESIDWLLEKFRYRELGVPPSQWQSIPPRGKIRHIKSPFQNCEAIIEEIARSADVEFALVEAVAFASMFAAPLILLSRQTAEAVRKFAIYVFRAEIFERDRELEFSLRFCNAAMTDLFAKSVRQAQRTLLGERDINDAIISRRTLSKEDGRKRFWRLGDGTQGNPFVLYLDLLRFIAKIKSQNLSDCPITSIVPAICIGIL